MTAGGFPLVAIAITVWIAKNLLDALKTLNATLTQMSKTLIEHDGNIRELRDDLRDHDTTLRTVLDRVRRDGDVDRRVPSPADTPVAR